MTDCILGFNFANGIEPASCLMRSVGVPVGAKLVGLSAIRAGFLIFSQEFAVVVMR